MIFGNKKHSELIQVLRSAEFGFATQADILAAVNGKVFDTGKRRISKSGYDIYIYM